MRGAGSLGIAIPPADDLHSQGGDFLHDVDAPQALLLAGASSKSLGLTSSSSHHQSTVVAVQGFASQRKIPKVLYN